MSCQICGKTDLFTEVSGGPACATCAIEFGISTPVAQHIVDRIRKDLQLEDGKFLECDARKAARRLLGRE